MSSFVCRMKAHQKGCIKELLKCALKEMKANQTAAREKGKTGKKGKDKGEKQGESGNIINY